PHVRLFAVRQLAAIGNPACRKMLLELLEHERDATVREAAAQAAEDLSPLRRLMGWWRFDEAGGGMAKDRTGHGNNGKVLGCKTVEGRIGRALEFDGKSYVELGRPANLPMADREFTVAAWVKAAADEGVVVARGGAFCGFSLYLKEGRPCFGIRRQQNRPAYIARADQQVAGRWVHLAGVVRTDRIELFVDGRLAASTNIPGLLLSDCGQGGWRSGSMPATARPS
ncbi:MAG: hypothetical protein GXP27_08010, partial [Planctomycetes bacterium]|nr:hypothetical protein [Planctomycetota bacterium]